jgi:hypothetical protein
MSIPAIAAATRVVPASAPDSTVRQASAATDTPIDEATQLPVPPRFPWLSRLSQQLEQAAPRKGAFASTPVVGDNIDRIA